MSERIQRRVAPRSEQEVAPVDLESRRRDEVDYEAVLDEIDATLQGSAEDYVRGFVQKGGQ